MTDTSMIAIGPLSTRLVTSMLRLQNLGEFVRYSVREDRYPYAAVVVACHITSSCVSDNTQRSKSTVDDEDFRIWHRS